MVPKISGVNYERRELSEEFKKKYIELYGRLLYNQRISRIFNKDGVVWTVD